MQAFLILLSIGAWHYFSSLETVISVGNASFGASSGALRLHSPHWKNQSDNVFEGVLGQEFSFKLKETKRCPVEGENVDCVEWEGVARLEIEHSSDDNIECYRFSWKTFTKDADPHDCFMTSGHHWYGGAHLRKDRWLIEKEPIPMTQYISSDTRFNQFESGDSYGGVLEHYWVSSEGLAIFVDDYNVPLHVGINSSQLCLKADFENSWYKNPNREFPKLIYNICMGVNVKSIHEYLSRKLWSRPIGLPDKALFKHPVWSTWARYKTEINQSKVLEFAREIESNGFKGSQIEIDDMYTTRYGDLEFDIQKFPDPSNMTGLLHSMGYRVTSWVTPFFNVDSKAFIEGEMKGYFIKDQRGQVPGLVSWWHGSAAVLDPTNPDAVKWYNVKLQALRDLGIDSFRFDAGESNFLPPDFVSYEMMTDPNYYSKAYAEIVSSFSTRRIEDIRVGYKTQHLPLMVRMMDKASNWGYDRGLKSLIPTCLLFGLIGYPFVLPDVIGGNVYNQYGTASATADIPEKELYIRWLEVSVFLPVMQYSVAPWQYDEETLAIARHYDTIRSNFVYERIVRAAEESVINGSPIIRPLWWHDPNDSENLGIYDEFFLGQDILVAPILEKEVYQRDIYLPKGVWLDVLRNKTRTGPIHLQDYSIKLNEIAYFKLENSS